ncbi:class I adenylate-forming enzyme family protein [Bacillus sp. T33-2]|uniref:class I adenylate-forming enzyme family protein n=1 Tax=Bacillus sp. T33-2 TaxID=2054168 RepID=UPI000C77A55D|nr:AMP-binding protein [Bacillus sp. T33-2]PLR91603.1 AMP-dependent synthetase [Bacillus sp. T33-2]
MEPVTMINRVAIGDIIRRTASRLPEKTALVDRDKRLTYRELNEESNRFANYLIGLGFQKGETVATICANSWQFVTAIFGIAKAGLVWVPINPGVSFNEKAYILSEVRARMLICDQLFVQDKKEELSTMCPELLVIGQTAVEAEQFEFALKMGDTREPEVEVGDRDIAQIMFTSGTTGTPKGVIVSHLSVFIASLANVIEANMRKEDVATAIMPIFHCAQHTLVTSFFHLGATLVIIPAFEPESLLKTIESEKVTWMFALPIMYRAILFHPKLKQFDTSSLRYCLYAMAPMDSKTLERGIEEFGAEFALGTGQTEMYPATLVFKPEYQLSKKGPYWGVPSLINDTAVMDVEGNLLGPGMVGEIVHRGPNVMSGYLNNDEETERSRQFGWHHTGDLGHWDEDGLLVFVDRKKDMIKTGGENVASILVEQTLLSHEKVANAVVVGLPHERWTEAVTAFVVPKPEMDVTKEEIITYCKEHLGSFQVPKEVVFMEQLPMTTTGKIQKHVIREKYSGLYLVKE